METNPKEIELNFDSSSGQDLEELEKARDYAVTFDNLFMLEPTAISYHSPYFDLLSFDSADLLVYGSLEDNKRIDNFKWLLSGKCFDIIREYSEFQQLVNN